MHQNLLLTPKAVSACATPAQCLMRCGYLRFRFVRYQCSRWFVLAIARIDFVSVYGLLNDLLW